jgi:uncharacterized membrane protein
MAKMQPNGHSDSDMARTAGRRLRTAILLTLLSLVVPIIAVALGVAILRVLGAFEGFLAVRAR